MKLYNEDSLVRMNKMVEKGTKVDLILTDPPYATIKGGKRKRKITENTNNNTKVMYQNNNFGWDIDYKTFLPKWLSLSYDLLKDGGQCYLMVNTKDLENFLRESRKAGFKLHNVLIWDKGNKVVNRWYMKQVEYVLFLRKGKAKPINNGGTANLIKVPNTRNKDHPTQKPVDLMKIFIENSSNEGDLVFDPFMGTGATGIASKLLERDFIGIERDEKFFSLAKTKINKTTK